MPEIGLQRSCVMAVIGQLVTAGVAQPVRMRVPIVNLIRLAIGVESDDPALDVRSLQADLRFGR
jgi:hypothetical protein